MVDGAYTLSGATAQRLADAVDALVAALDDAAALRRLRQPRMVQSAA